MMGGIRRGRWLLLSRAACALIALAVVVAGQDAPAVPSTTPAQGPRPIVRAVRVHGNARYTDEQLIAAFGQGLGQALLGESGLRRGVEVLFDTFHVRTTVQLVPPADGGEQVELLLEVEELPMDLELRITGNVEIDDDKLREWAGIGAREELYLYQAPRIRARLLQHYRDEGYYFADVRVVERPAGVDPESGQATAPDVIFEIKEGPEVKVRDV